MTAKESPRGGYRKSLTSREARDLAAIDAQAAELDKLRRELTHRRYLIVNRACARARAAREVRS